MSAGQEGNFGFFLLELKPEDYGIQGKQIIPA